MKLSCHQTYKINELNYKRDRERTIFCQDFKFDLSKKKSSIPQQKNVIDLDDQNFILIKSQK